MLCTETQVCLNYLPKMIRSSVSRRIVSSIATSILSAIQSCMSPSICKSRTKASFHPSSLVIRSNSQNRQEHNWVVIIYDHHVESARHRLDSAERFVQLADRHRCYDQPEQCRNFRIGEIFEVRGSSRLGTTSDTRVSGARWSNSRSEAEITSML